MVRGHKYGVPSARTCSGAQIITESRPFPGVNLRDFECRSRQMPRPASSAAYAPKKFLPQTRIVRQLIALAAGEAKTAPQTGKASGRDRVCPYVEIRLGACQLKKKHTKHNIKQQ